MTSGADDTDYATLGLSIRRAMLRAGSRNPPSRNRPLVIRWGDKLIQTVDVFPVPARGIVRGEFLGSKGSVEQGFDIEADGGLVLANGARIRILRTWNDPKFEPAFEYEFRTDEGRLRVWNVYKARGRIAEEKWTGNAGMHVEHVSAFERVYHCSPGSADPCDFGSLVFKITVRDLRP